MVKSFTLDVGLNGHPVYIVRNSKSIRVFMCVGLNQTWFSTRIDKQEAKELFNNHWLSSYADEFLA